MRRNDGRGAAPVVSRLQATLIGFFACAALILAVTYGVAPTAFAGTVPLDADTIARHPPGLTLFVAAIVAVIAMLIVGVARRWRWIFWLVLVACASSLLHLPLTLLQLVGVVAGGPPRWYGVLQGCAEIVQIALAAWMVRLSRRGGAWGMMRSENRQKPPGG